MREPYEEAGSVEVQDELDGSLHEVLDGDAFIGYFARQGILADVAQSPLDDEDEFGEGVDEID
jgi:hypothetical protein